jgi:hypothetical protein
MEIYRHCSLIACFLITIHTVDAQPTKSPRSWQYSIMTGAGISRFEVNGIQTEKYPTAEFKIGGVVKKSFNSRIGFRSGLNVCIKSKRNSYLTDGVYYNGKGFLIPSLDETTSKKTHVAIELPIALYGKFAWNSELVFGVMGRAWQATDLPGDILKSQQEYGLWGALNKPVTKRIDAGIELYWGLRKFPTGLLIGGPNYTVKNSFLTGNIIYRL